MQSILICEVVHIGDVIAALPMAYAIKHYWPGCKITFLCTHYTKHLFEFTQDVDDIILWDDLKSLSIDDAARQIQRHQFDAVIHSHSKKIITKIMKKAKIPTRINQGFRIDTIPYSNRLIRPLTRYPSTHMMQYNLKFLAKLNSPHPDIKTLDQCNRSDLHKMIRLNQPPINKFVKTVLDNNRFNLVLHPFSNSAQEWPTQYFSELINSLDKTHYNIIITGSAAEGEQLKQTPLSQKKHITNICGKTSLKDLFILLTHVDGLVTNSTGPLHAAAALDTHCLGIYTNHKNINIDRWEAIGKHALSIESQTPCPDRHIKIEDNPDCPCIHDISVKKVQSIIKQWYAMRFPTS